MVLTLDSGKILGAARVFLGDTFSVSMDVEVGPDSGPHSFLKCQNICFICSYFRVTQWRVSGRYQGVDTGSHINVIVQQHFVCISGKAHSCLIISCA